MPLEIAFLRAQNWSRLKPYYQSTIILPSRATAFLCEQGKNRDASLLSETLQNEMHACKTREDKKIQAWSASRKRSERDRNEIQIA